LTSGGTPDGTRNEKALDLAEGEVAFAEAEELG
jgi:hypothetical protein